MVNLTRIYTRTGDAGSTFRIGLVGAADPVAALEETAAAFGVTTRWVSMALKAVPPMSGDRIRFPT